MPQLGRLASPPPSPGRLVQAFGAASPSYLEFDVEPLAGEPDKAVFESAGKAASRSGVFNMTASALSPRAASVPLLPPAGGTMLQRGAHPGPPPLSTGACSDDAEAGAAAEPPAQAAAQARSPLALMAAPMQVPVGSVLFSVASCVLALTFFVLFLAHNDRWEETGCVLLLTAASAAAGPATLTLTAVRTRARGGGGGAWSQRAASAEGSAQRKATCVALRNSSVWQHCFASRRRTPPPLPLPHLSHRPPLPPRRR